MFDYDVKFVYEYSYIGITVVADSDEEAVAMAWNVLSEQDIDAPEPQEIMIEQVGGYGV